MCFLFQRPTGSTHLDNPLLYTAVVLLHHVATLDMMKKLQNEYPDHRRW